MSDVKFSCPHCSQHISCDQGWVGQVIQCPGCQQQIKVPQAQTGLRVPSAPTLPPVNAPVMPSAPAAAAQRPVPEKWCGAAIASIILLFFGPIRWIISIFCAQSAKDQIRMNPRLRGDVMATVGMVISYAMCGMAICMVALWFVLKHYAEKRMAERQKAVAEQRAAMQKAWRTPSENGGTVPADRGPYVPPPPTAYLEPKLPLPANPVKGTVGGQSFQYEHAFVNQSQFVLRQGAFSQADRQITITTFVSPKDLAGKNLLVTPDMKMTKLKATAEWIDASGQKQSVWKPWGYSLSLKFGQIEGGKVTGTIDLQMTGASIKGDFVAVVQ